MVKALLKGNSGHKAGIFILQSPAISSRALLIMQRWNDTGCQAIKEIIVRIINAIAIVGLVMTTFISCDKNVNTTGCIGLGDSTVVKVKYGEKKYLCNNDSSCFSFTKLISDSRCPSDVICVWQGTASIESGTCNGEEGSVTLEIYHPVDYTINGVNYTIELTGLDPYPSISHPHEISEYVAAITVKKK